MEPAGGQGYWVPAESPLSPVLRSVAVKYQDSLSASPGAPGHI